MHPSTSPNTMNDDSIPQASSLSLLSNATVSFGHRQPSTGNTDAQPEISGFANTHDGDSTSILEESKHATQAQAWRGLTLQEARSQKLTKRQDYQAWWLLSRVPTVHREWDNLGPVDPAPVEVREKLKRQLANLQADSAIKGGRLDELIDHIHKTTHPDFDWIWTEEMWELFLRLHKAREKEKAKCFAKVEESLAESKASRRAAMSFCVRVSKLVRSLSRGGRPTEEEVDRVRNPQRYEGSETDEYN
jgi:hypothetical protein